MCARLADFAALAESAHESIRGFDAFRNADPVRALDWPDDVTEQWLYDHANNGAFLADYGNVDLSRLRWDVEVHTASDLAAMPTGPSDGDAIDDYASNPDHWISVRSGGIHVGVAQMWHVHGTWKRWPLLIDQRTLTPPGVGLQIIEGRTRVGILKGRLAQRAHVATRHLVWVARPRD